MYAANEIYSKVFQLDSQKLWRCALDERVHIYLCGEQSRDAMKKKEPKKILTVAMDERVEIVNGVFSLNEEKFAPFWWSEHVEK